MLRFVRKYSLLTRQNDWISINNNIATIGITTYTQQKLDHILFIDFPEMNKKINLDDNMVSLESLSGKFDIMSLISGTVVDINKTLVTDPEHINKLNPSEKWLVKLNMMYYDMLF